MNKEVAQALAESRGASQHLPKTWSATEQFDCNLWTAHDVNVDGTHYGPYALCWTCREEWREWKNQRLAEKLSAAQRREFNAQLLDQQCY